MPTLRVTGFDGVVPRTSPTMLGDSQAQVASNVKLYSKELRYWRGPTLNYTPALSNPTTIYRLYGSTSSIWLTWAADVDVAPGPLADTTENRVYFTGSDTPKKTNYALASTSAPYPSTTYEMGVPAPSVAPAVTSSGSTASTYNIDIDSTVAANDGAVLTGSVHLSGSTSSTADTVSLVDFGTTKTLTIGSSVGTSEDGAATQTPTPAFTSTLTTTGFTASADHFTNLGGVGSTTLETRAYVYTFVNKFGSVYEESAPSPASALTTIAFGQYCTVSGFQTPPSAGYNIVSIRIYRTVSGATTDSYQFVTEIPVGTSSYIDTLTAAQLGKTIGTIGWLPPPTNLTGLVALANGSLAGFVGNTVYFSEPYNPHAWPLAYAITIPYNIVGLGAWGSTVVACTEKFPYMISGITPGAMSVEQVQVPEPCVAKSTIASDEFGVIYASPNGLVSIGPSGAQIITNALFRRDEWQATYPASMRGVIYDGKYFGVYLSPYQANPAMIISRDDYPALSYLTFNATAAHLDVRTGKMFFVSASNGKIYELDSDSTNPYTYTWRSKRFVLPHGTSFSALRLDANYTQTVGNSTYQAQMAAAIAYNNAAFSQPLLDAVDDQALNVVEVNGSTLQNLPVAQAIRSVTVQIYADSILVATITAGKMDPIRLPPFKGREIEVAVSGNIDVRSLTMATTVPELMGG